jgi:hypothetical protein
VIDGEDPHGDVPTRDGSHRATALA